LATQRLLVGSRASLEHQTHVEAFSEKFPAALAGALLARLHHRKWRRFPKTVNELRDFNVSSVLTEFYPLDDSRDRRELTILSSLLDLILEDTEESKGFALDCICQRLKTITSLSGVEGSRRKGLIESGEKLELLTQLASLRERGEQPKERKK